MLLYTYIHALAQIREGANGARQGQGFLFSQNSVHTG